MMNHFRTLLSISICATTHWASLSEVIATVSARLSTSKPKQTDYEEIELEEVSVDVLEVRRCSLTLSKPMLKAPMVSALETIISQSASKFQHLHSISKYQNPC